MSVVVPFVPQPIPNVCKPGTWHWIYSTERAATFTEEHDTWMLSQTPFPVGSFYGDDIVEKVAASFTFESGWAWVLDLRQPQGVELEGYWGLLMPPTMAPPPAVIVCEQCGVTEGVRLVTAMTAYEDSARNRPMLFCESCTQDYEEYWREMWDNYYGMLI